MELGVMAEMADLASHAPEALGQRLAAMEQGLYQIAVRILDDEAAAEDVVQETFVQALRQMKTDVTEREQRVWLYRVASNKAKDHLRAEAHRRKREVAVTTARATVTGRPDEIVRALKVAMGKLDRKYRVPLALCYEQGFTKRDAAAVLGMPEATLSDHIRTGLAKLRKTLEHAGYPAAVATVLGGLKQTAPAVPASLAGRVKELIAKGAAKTAAGAGASASASANGGIAMKIIAGLVLAGAAAAGLAVMSGGGGNAPLPSEAPSGKHKDFEYTTIGNGRVFIEHAAMSGAFGHLDGPARGGMARQIFGATADAAGNLYLYDHDTMTVRAVRARDRRLFTLAGGRYHNMGTPTAKEGPADQLRLFCACFIAMPGLAAVGNPMDGDGSLYVVDDTNVLVRLWRNKEKGGIWWYECIAGLGKTPAANGASAAETRLSSAQVVSTPGGEVGLITGSSRSAALYWLREGKLVAAYDQAFVEKQAGATFYCRGVDVEGNFVGSTGAYTQAKPFLIVVSADGKSVKKLPTPYPPQWTVCADQKKPGRYFFRACDDYTIQYVDMAGRACRLLRNGSWKPLNENIGNRGFREGLNWSRGNTLPDGRYLGYSTSAASHVFAMAFLDEGK